MGNHKSSSILLLQMQTLYIYIYIYLYMYIQRKRFFLAILWGIFTERVCTQWLAQSEKAKHTFQHFFQILQVCAIDFYSSPPSFSFYLQHNCITTNRSPLLTQGAKHSFSEALLKPGLVNVAETDSSPMYCRLAYKSILTDIKRV